MSKLKLAVGVVLLILVGALIGSLGTGLFVKQRAERFALGGPGPPEGAGFIIKRLTHRLDLSAIQRSEIKQLIDEYNEKIFDVRSQYLPEIKKINDQVFTSLREKLNDEQKEKMDHLQERVDSMHERVPFRRRSSGKGPGHHPDSIREHLRLTQEQADQIRPIIAESTQKKEALFEGRGGTNRPERLQLRQEMDRIDTQTEEKLAQILSEDQLETYRNLPTRNRFGKRSGMGPPGFMERSLPMDPNRSP